MLKVRLKTRVYYNGAAYAANEPFEISEKDKAEFASLGAEFLTEKQATKIEKETPVTSKPIPAVSSTPNPQIIPEPEPTTEVGASFYGLKEETETEKPSSSSEVKEETKAKPKKKARKKAKSGSDA